MALALAAILPSCALLPPDARVPHVPYVGMSEQAVRAELGNPSSEFPGHFANPPLSTRKRYPGRIKTLVYKRRAGARYIAFQKELSGWVAIYSGWLRKGSRF